MDDIQTFKCNLYVNLVLTAPHEFKPKKEWFNKKDTSCQVNYVPNVDVIT